MTPKQIVLSLNSEQIREALRDNERERQSLLILLRAARAAERKEMAKKQGARPMEPIPSFSGSVTKDEVVAKVTAYVKRVAGGTDEAAYKTIFAANDEDNDGRISLNELTGILAKAGIGSGIGQRIVRLTVGNEIIDLFDADKDGYIEWEEFLAVFQKK